jgi:hypothetical protein
MVRVCCLLSVDYPFSKDSRFDTNGFDADTTVVEDGYGVSYSIHDNNIRWCVTTKNNDAEKFGKALTDAAEELKSVMDRAKAAGGQ